MGKRRRSREFALQALYQQNITRQDVPRILGQLRAHFSSMEERDDFGEQIVIGVLEHNSQIDRLIEQYSEHWRLDRMTLIDRTILRIATFELLYRNDIPAKVTLNEAVDLGKRFGSADSGGFINGILDRIQREAVHKTDAKD